jgi:hypothetical protein
LGNPANPALDYVEDWEICFLSEKSFINAIGTPQGLDQKDLQEHLYVNILVSPDPFSPTPSSSSAVNAPENTEEDPEPSDGDTKTG